MREMPQNSTMRMILQIGIAAKGRNLAMVPKSARNTLLTCWHRREKLATPSLASKAGYVEVHRA
jgi:hypothetical protein